MSGLCRTKTTGWPMREDENKGPYLVTSRIVTYGVPNRNGDIYAPSCSPLFTPRPPTAGDRVIDESGLHGVIHETDVRILREDEVCVLFDNDTYDFKMACELTREPRSTPLAHGDRVITHDGIHGEVKTSEEGTLCGPGIIRVFLDNGFHRVCHESMLTRETERSEGQQTNQGQSDE